jgi:SAM-dependent methyltransferase
MQKLIPKKVKETIRDLLGITSLQKRIELLNELLLESKEESWERSRKRWKQSKPTVSVTWNKEISGDNFITKVQSYNAFQPEKSILEIGPGYGRLLKSCLKHNVPFKDYFGVDISKENIKYLREKFTGRNIHFIHGDIETILLPKTFDLVLSTLTFKHLYPTFENALRNITKFMNPNSMLFFDLIEGKKKYFENDGVTYIRFYSQPEVLRILRNFDLEFIAFDRVEHDRNRPRLLVVARKQV